MIQLSVLCYSQRPCSGKYDYDFMDYTIRVLVKCREYGFRVYMDPHQDTVSIVHYCSAYCIHLISFSF